jgi:murein DD-endopeptidase MepM/ murein hydrolase activator NlpD
MTNAHRDLATPELWNRSLERSRRRRELLPKARRESARRKHISAALATAVVAGPGTPLAAAQVSGDLSVAVAAESPANRAIEIREGGLPLQLGSQGDLVAHVQTKLGVASDGIFGPLTDAAVRKYQQSAGLEVDGVVGPRTWSSLFETAGASGAALGGSNVPPEVKQQVEQRLAAQGNAGAGVGGQLGATTPAPAGDTTVPNSRVDTTLPTTQAPSGGGSCGSSTISTPVRGTVTSEFGPRGGRNHDGIDIAAATGTAVRAAACGTVSLAGQQSGYGNIVCITHTSQFSTCYAHLSRFGVTSGAQVQQGQIIGYVGCTGSCTGPHLHFETRVDGQAQDPRTYLSGGAIPGGQATVAGATSTSTSSSSTATRQATVTADGSASTTATSPESVTISTAPTTATVTGTTAPATSAPAEAAEPLAAELAPAEAAPEAVAVEAPAEPVAVEAAPAEVVTAEPVAVEAAPAEVVAAEPVAVEAPAEPVAVEAAPAEVVAAEPVAVEAAPPEPVAVEAAPPEPVAVEATAPAEPVAAEPVAVEPAAAEVAAEPVAVEAAPAEPVAAEPVAAEAEPAEPVAAEAEPAEPVEAQVAAPAEASASVAPTADTAAATSGGAEAQVDAAATTAVQ